ncbi:MAG: hypothetical protein QG604_904 [Candidatus Dependentiae bacterium]|nr:hypothetical protein [Candidatus Dependentiae bacterium]
MKMTGLAMLMSIVVVGGVVGSEAGPVNCFRHWGRGIESYETFSSYGAIYRECSEIPGWLALTGRLQRMAAVLGGRKNEPAFKRQIHDTILPVDQTMGLNDRIIKKVNKPRIRRWLLDFRLADLAVQASVECDGLDEAGFASTLHAWYLLLQTEMLVWAVSKNGFSEVEIDFLVAQGEAFIARIARKAGAAVIADRCAVASDETEADLSTAFNKRLGLK